MTTYNAILHTLYISSPMLLFMAACLALRLWSDSRLGAYTDELVEKRRKAAEKPAEESINKVAA